VLPDLAEFFNRLLPARRGNARSAGSLEDPRVSLDDPAFWETLGHQRADSGLSIGPEEALRFGPVYQCLEIKSADVGAATLHCHKNDVEPGADDIDYNQSCERVCSLQWNDLTPANEGWQNLVFHHQLFGNGYAYIGRQGGAPNGPIQWMANLVPTAVTPLIDKDTGALVYELMLDGEVHILNHWEVFHLKGLSLGGGKALSCINLMRNELGLALAGKLYLSKFFERGGHHGGILSIPPGTTPKSVENLEKGVAKRSSPANWFKTLVLREGAQWHSATVDPRAAQMHELNDDEARAVCHFFNMPPWKLGLRNSESYNSAEQAAKAYIMGSLLHVTSRIQGEANIKLLSERTRRARSHRFEHNFSKLVEADIKTLNEVLAIQRQNEVINANDWRKKINLPARADEKASEYYNPSTRGQTDRPAETSQAGTSRSRSTDDTEDPEDTDTQSAATPSKSHKRLLDQAVSRAAKRLATVCQNKARKPNDLLAWCDSKAVDHQSIVDEELDVSLSCVVNEQKASLLMLASRQWLTGVLTAGVSVFLEPPHKPAELEGNVKAFLAEFQQTVTDLWHKEIFNAI
jgi:HK97 family phage portal protein